MLGLFDSGSGGLNTVRFLKSAGLDRDLIYLIDRNNAPYGTKSEKQIAKITENNVKALTGMGAERVLIACCTASTAHHLLPQREKAASIPIISAIAREAREKTQTRKIGVLATRHTASSHAFRSALPDCEVTEISASELVGRIDSGMSDEEMTEADGKMLKELLAPLIAAKIDTLILGCTHFSSIRLTAERILHEYGISRTVDSAKVGADILTQLIRK